ncbi:hypothetical protein [Austwickia chelonae]|uniref:hypothetical protein n=1 Tax=Austwickia chelonae TaxID=100225 RepID=UPI0002DE5BD9|nr:hypothetical protein [Austwickia chelonae]
MLASHDLVNANDDVERLRLLSRREKTTGRSPVATAPCRASRERRTAAILDP